MPHSVHLPKVDWKCPVCEHYNKDGFYSSCEECDTEVEILKGKVSPTIEELFEEWKGTIPKVQNVMWTGLHEACESFL